MQLIGATPTGSYAHDQGSHAVRVGIMDTGVDGKHPDIAPNFDRALSRNFTMDNSEPGIDDGPCEHPSCVDPADEDDDGHGTHVASTIGSPLNGLGMAGVAPKVDIVNIRAGQDTGFFLLQPTVDALTYAGRVGIDVVNMSFYIDPWLFNCTSNPADSPEEQAAAAHDHRGHDARGELRAPPRGDADRGRGQRVDGPRQPDVRRHEPGLPAGRRARAHDRQRLPEHAERGAARARRLVGGPGQPRVARRTRARRSTPTTASSRRSSPHRAATAASSSARRSSTRPENRILAAYPLNVAQACGEVDANGVPNGTTLCDAINPGTVVPRSVPLVRNCANGVCALYQWIQGTSMASPHAVGVAALIVAEKGKRDFARGGLTLDPDKVERVLRARRPTRRARPRSRSCTRATPGSFDATCVGTPEFNGFYGDGIVNALAASKSGGGGRR